MVYGEASLNNLLAGKAVQHASIGFAKCFCSAIQITSVRSALRFLVVRNRKTAITHLEAKFLGPVVSSPGPNERSAPGFPSGNTVSFAPPVRVYSGAPAPLDTSMRIVSSDKPHLSIALIPWCNDWQSTTGRIIWLFNLTLCFAAPWLDFFENFGFRSAKSGARADICDNPTSGIYFIATNNFGDLLNSFQ